MCSDYLVNRPLKLPGRKIIITKRMVEDAIRSTKSQSQAAKWIGVSYNTYKKYAKFYGLWENHINQAGVGIKKGWGAYRISLDEILNGRKVSSLYTKAFFKRRLIEEGYLQEECSICGWNESKLTDKKICLSLDYIDGNSDNKSLDNIRILCPNCYLSNNGFFHSSTSFCK
tara:strand:- start:677 stop:1189 length:513 start_codon:yes stop_codon:yes gene_type:complete